MRIASSIQEQLRAIVEDEGLSLLATEVVGSGPHAILRLIVDSPDGVNLDNCASVSKQASALLDLEDTITHKYTLEVSSPGLDRKMYSMDDYQNNIGKRIKIRMKPSFRKNRNETGELLGVEDELVKLRLDSGELLELPWDEVYETRLDIDWESVLKEGKGRQ